MARHFRESLNDLDKKIESLYLAAGDDVLELMALEDALSRDVAKFETEKKMGRVRVYDKWGLQTSEKILELKEGEFMLMPTLGVF